MIDRWQNVIKALLLLAMGLFLFDRIATGTLDYYISQRFAPYTLVAVLILSLLAGSYALSQPFSRRGRKTVPEHLHEDDLEHHHGHEHVLRQAQESHEHEREHEHEHHRLSWSGVLIVLAPVVLGVLVAPQPLGAPALDNRELSPDVQRSVMPAAVRRATEKSTLDYNLMDWYYALHATELSAELDGAEADVVGFVYHDPALNEGEYWLVRFAVSCCVADASAMSLLVRWPDAATLAENQWVQVAGQIDAGQVDNRNLPALDASTVELIPTPDQPYLYP